MEALCSTARASNSATERDVAVQQGGNSVAEGKRDIGGACCIPGLKKTKVYQTLFVFFEVV